MIGSPVMIIAVPYTHLEFDMLTNQRAKMWSDEMKRKLATRTMKLKIPPNDNTKGLLGPDEPRLTIKTAFVNTKKRKRHLFLKK
jgi:hypothetical protein